MKKNLVKKNNAIQNSVKLKIVEKEDELHRLEKEIMNCKKRVKQIEESNTWKIAKPIRFLRKFSKQNDEFQMLFERLNEAELELSKAREEIAKLKLLDEQLNTSTIQQLMREWKDSATLLTYLESIIEYKNKIQENYKDALSFIGRLYMRKDDLYKHAIYKKIMSGLCIEEIPEFIIRAGLTEEAMSLERVSSYRTLLHQRMRRLQLHQSLPEWILDDKEKAYHFVDGLQIPVPKVDGKTYTVNTLPEREGIVIKPINGAGARGVYLVHRFNHIFDVKNSTILTSLEELYSNIYNDLQSGAVHQDVWMVEEIIYENKEQLQAARDFKFYMFYGKVGLILEIIREPEIRHCWWNNEGERVYTGKYEETLFQGIGVTENDIKMVEKLSEEIPAPFIRIDLLSSEDRLIFGEFTPKPGDYDDFNQETDQLLGDYYLKAQARLEEDFMNGKQFKAFQTLQRKDTFQLS